MSDDMQLSPSRCCHPGGRKKVRRDEWIRDNSRLGQNKVEAHIGLQGRVMLRQDAGRMSGRQGVTVKWPSNCRDWTLCCEDDKCTEGAWMADEPKNSGPEKVNVGKQSGTL